MATTPAPAFGTAFAPQILVQRYSEGRWHPAELTAYGPFSLPPACAVFHYAQEIFEGFKCYRQPDGRLALFRPERNLARLNASARRLCMPEMDEKRALADIERFVRAVADAVPPPPHTLYIRPCMFARDEVIRVKPASSYVYFVVACVVGDYFAGDDPRGVRLRTETEYTRAAPGGTGMAKCGGNYAASLAAQARAAAEGFDQVVWLDAREHRYVEEMGGMNIMFVIDGALVTPSLDAGTILAGVTRASLLELANHLGIRTEERAISVDELAAAWQAGRLTECFACGTAAVITPIRELVHRGEVIYRNEGKEPGRLTLELKQRLMDIQFGRADDPFGWRRIVS
ncbi:MAG TPA: branched-chain amino acid aminotransferase [Gammaproteobacteria bacterium]|nr:branched-chain amino acid aminotransferase [Gammaproteobacteria bacterium]